MNKPTRRQWRGYTVLCFLLLAILIALLFRNCNQRNNSAVNNDTVSIIIDSQLEQAINLFGDSITKQTKKEYRNYRQRQYQHHFDYDTSHHKIRKSRPQKNKIIVELNDADTSALQQLYGIGPSFARRIVNYRNLLGGFTRKEQLLEVYGMTNDRYEAIIPYISIDTSRITTLNINTATVEQLRRHPYLDYYQARAIVDFRKSGFHFSSLDDLLLVNLIDEKTVINLKGYIQFN